MQGGLQVATTRIKNNICKGTSLSIHDQFIKRNGIATTVYQSLLKALNGMLSDLERSCPNFKGGPIIETHHFITNVKIDTLLIKKKM